jgi:hypothetical protein
MFLIIERLIRVSKTVFYHYIIAFHFRNLDGVLKHLLLKKALYEYRLKVKAGLNSAKGEELNLGITIF